MDKALAIGKSSATSSLQLMIGVAGSSIIMAIGTFVLAALLNADQVGLYGMALIPSTIIGFFRDWGVNSALTQQIARLRATGKDYDAHDLIYAGVLFELISGIVLSVVCFAVAQPLAYLLSPSDVSELSFYISVMSFSIFGGALFAAGSGIFLGFERMKLNSLTLILQALVKTALGPLLIVIGFGVLGAIYAAMASFVAGGIIAILIVYFSLFRPLGKCKTGRCNIKATLRPMLSYGLPLTVSAIVFGVLPQVFAFTMAVYAGKEMMGNYYVSTYFVILTTFIILPVSNTLFPVFSKINPEREPELLKTVFSSAVKYMSILLVPASLLLITLSTPAINLLFPQVGFLQGLTAISPVPKYPYAPLFLSLSCLTSLLVVIGFYTLSSFQTGLRQTRQLMKQSLVMLAVGLPLALVAVGYFYSFGGPVHAVVAGILGNFFSTAINAAWASYWCWKTYKVHADFKISFKILVSSLIASAVAYVFVTFVSLPYLLSLFGGLIIFLVTYLSTAPLLGAINETDIGNFKSMVSGLGALSKLFMVPLRYMQWMCRFNNRKSAL
ncbi:MAG: oligosaccharide flippase family protein [Candidatus Bathyarchaeota archaeon]|nr:oligosaccharide flippase family protein [Candidatus Bathyarchaeota archaeon]